MSIYSFIDSLLGIDENEVVGKNGERLTANKLKWISFMGREGRILKNVYIPKKDGDTTEIDLLFITEKGIFVIESKNYSGYIFGDGKTAKWTTTLFAGRNIRGQKQVEKHQFYNPIWQNYNHIKYLRVSGDRCPDDITHRILGKMRVKVYYLSGKGCLRM